MLPSEESCTIISSDENSSDYDTNDEPFNKLNAYGNSSYKSSDEYDFKCNDGRSREESDPYDEKSYAYEDKQPVDMDSSDNESYKQIDLINFDDNSYGHGDDHRSADFNNSEGNDIIAHICYFINTPKGCKFGDRCRYSHIIEYTYADEEQARACWAQTLRLV